MRVAICSDRSESKTITFKIMQTVHKYCNSCQLKHKTILDKFVKSYTSLKRNSNLLPFLFQNSFWRSPVQGKSSINIYLIIELMLENCWDCSWNYFDIFSEWWYHFWSKISLNADRIKMIYTHNIVRFWLEVFYW